MTVTYAVEGISGKEFSTMHCCEGHRQIHVERRPRVIGSIRGG